MPVVTTLHTVLSEPDAAQRQVMEELIRLSHRLVVMSARAAEILRKVHTVPAGVMDVIPHGIPDVPFVDPYFYAASIRIASGSKGGPCSSPSVCSRRTRASNT